MSKKTKILIVDDNENDLILTDTLLRGYGYEVISAENGVDALEKLRNNSIDMIVSDILMPMMDGFQFCRECKRDDSIKSIPFVFYTATYNDKKDEEFALSLGAEKFMLKPLEPEVFINTLKSFIEERKNAVPVTLKTPVDNEEVYLEKYNKRLVKKLEEKVLDLEKEIESRIQAEEKYHNLFHAAYDAIFLADVETGIILDANKSAEKLIGMPAEELVGMHQSQLIPREDAEYYKYILEKNVLRGMAEDEVFVMHKDGYKIPVSISASVVEYGAKKAIMGMFRDMTERKKAERDIKQLNELLGQSRVWLDNSPVCTKVVDLDFNLQYMSAAGKKALKIDDVTKLYGKPYPFDFFPESFKDSMTNNLEQVKETGGVITEEAPICDIEGSELWFQATLVPVRDDEGRIDFIIIVSVDINERKKMEEELKSLNESLERRVTERTEEVMTKNVELIGEISKRKKAEEQIKASLKEKDTLLMEIHHRVRNNLQIISSLLSLDTKNLKDEQSIKIFKEAQNRIRSMASIHEILYESNYLSNIDFSQFVNTLTDKLFNSYGIDPGKILLKTDIMDVSLKIEQAIPLGLLVNELFSNSLEHAFPFDKTRVGSFDSEQAKQEEHEISISLTSLPDNKIKLIVCDNGVGIPEDLDFRTADSLGLNLVNILAEEQLKGEINLDSSVKGTKFQIIFE